MHGHDWHRRTVNNHKKIRAGRLLCTTKFSKKHVVHSYGLNIPALMRILKSSIVGADMALAGRLFQRPTADGEKGSIVGVDGTIWYQESLLMTSS